MRVLGLDLGLQCGFAWTERDKVDTRPDHVGTWDFRKERRESKGRVFGELFWNLIGLDPDVVVYELVRGHKGLTAAHWFGGFEAVVLAYCSTEEKEVHSIHTGRIKKWATGNGNADKDLMMNMARLRLKCTVKDDNAADALWVLDAYLHGVK